MGDMDWIVKKNVNFKNVKLVSNMAQKLWLWYYYSFLSLHSKISVLLFSVLFRIKN